MNSAGGECLRLREESDSRHGLQQESESCSAVATTSTLVPKLCLGTRRAAQETLLRKFRLPDNLRRVMSDDSKQWSKLLQSIAKGVVIPIIGRDLLQVEIDGKSQLLYEYLAQRLARELEV